MLKKLQKIGIKFNYLKLRFFQSKIEWERRKNSEIQKLCFKSILFSIKCSPPTAIQRRARLNHCIKCLFNHIPIQVHKFSSYCISNCLTLWGWLFLGTSQSLFNVSPKERSHKRLNRGIEGAKTS